jgi:hypothetical protein
MSRSRCRLPVARPSVTSRASSEVDFRSVPVNAKNTANLIRRCADRQGSTWEDRAPMRFREGQRAVAAPADGHDSGHGSWTTPARRSGRGMGRVLAAIVGERPNVNGVRFIVPELAESQRRLLDSLVRSSSGKPDSGTSMMAGELMTPPEQERRPQVAGPSCRSRGEARGPGAEHQSWRGVDARHTVYLDERRRPSLLPWCAEVQGDFGGLVTDRQP